MGIGSFPGVKSGRSVTLTPDSLPAIPVIFCNHKNQINFRGHAQTNLKRDENMCCNLVVNIKIGNHGKQAVS
jgi:hypothetical protein